MTYTNTWAESQPAQVNAANTLGTSDRTIKQDFRERLNSLLGVAISTALADPIVASTSSIATLRAELTAINALLPLVAGGAQHTTIHASAFQKASASANAYDPTQDPVAVLNAAPIIIIAPLLLPLGSVLTNISAFVHTSGANQCTFTMTLYKKTLTAVSTTGTIDATVTKSSGWSTDTMVTLPFTADLDETFASNVAYAIRIAITANGDTMYFHGVDVSWVTAAF